MAFLDVSFLNNTVLQWMIAALWLIGLPSLTLKIHRLVAQHLISRLEQIERLAGAGNLWEAVGRGGLTVFTILIGTTQAVNTLTLLYSIEVLIAALLPILRLGLLVWLAMRVQQWLSPEMSIQGVFVNQILPMLALLLSLFSLIRFFVTRPLTCVPLCSSANIISTDLSDTSLSGVSFEQATLRGSDFTNTDLSGAFLTGADLSNAKLSNVNLTGASLQGANLTGADMRGAIFTNADFSGAILTHADMTQADLSRTRMDGATLIETKLIEAIMSGVDVSGAMMRDVSLTGAILTDAQLNGAYLSGADLSGANLSGANLSGASLNHANLTGTDVQQANLSGAALMGADLTSADLTGAKLIGANLLGSTLKGSVLFSADLRGARLVSGEIIPSDILKDHVLNELNEVSQRLLVADANLRGVQFDSTTRWPDGKAIFLADTVGVNMNDAPTHVESPEVTIIGPPMSERLNWAMIAGATAHAVDFNRFDGLTAFTVLCADDAINLLLIDRPIPKEQHEQCKEAGQTPVEIVVARTAFVLIIHPENEFAYEMTLEEAKRVLSAERWTEVDPRWPSVGVGRYLPHPDSAEFALISQWSESPDNFSWQDDPATLFSTNSADTVRDLVNDPFGVAVVDYATYLQNRGSLRLVQIEGVKLSAETVARGTYPFVLPLYLYATRADADSPAVSAYIDYFLDHIDEVAAESDFFPTRNKARRVVQVVASE